MSFPKIVASVGIGLVGLAWVTRPKPYPPLGSTTGVPGLGPFAYPEPHLAAKYESKSGRGNLAGFPSNSVSSFSERREIEQILVAALRKTDGIYLALPGSQSGVAERCLTQEELDALRREERIFEAPWTPQDLARNCGRFWPDARGVWLAPKCTVWINHEDHFEAFGEDSEKVLQLLRNISHS